MPAKHLLHSVEPSTAAYVPAEHGEQPFEVGYVPNGHAPQLLAPGADQSPGLHGKQFEPPGVSLQWCRVWDEETQSRPRIMYTHVVPVVSYTCVSTPHAAHLQLGVDVCNVPSTLQLNLRVYAVGNHQQRHAQSMHRFLRVVHGPPVGASSAVAAVSRASCCCECADRASRARRSLRPTAVERHTFKPCRVDQPIYTVHH